MPVSSINSAMPHNLIQQAHSEAAQTDAASKSQSRSASSLNTESKQPEFGFFQSMSSAEKKSAKVHVEDMKARLLDIHQKGSLLKQHPMPSLVKDYISEVRSFLTDLRDSAYSSNERDGVFQKIDVVDEKLDQLADQILQQEKEGLELADSLGELQGLLIDILV